MPHRRPFTRISIALPAIDLQTYASAARLLARIMGKQAPDAGALVQAQLIGRDPTGVADEYLDSIRWPSAQGRVVSLRRSRSKPTPTASGAKRPQRRSLAQPPHTK